jgi:lipopolysaccharide export LptBFGC system permease protein LptF
VYWATAAIFNALGLETILPPFLAAWSPNVIFGALGAYFFLFIPT